jgi:thiosulfate/3-mercaptopyruvate sulfurtransferase
MQPVFISADRDLIGRGRRSGAAAGACAAGRLEHLRADPLNVPYSKLVDTKEGTLLGAETLRAVFVDAGIDPSQPAICTCGSGISACVIAFALHRLGNRNVAVYDGSWSEWGASA